MEGIQVEKQKQIFFNYSLLIKSMPMHVSILSVEKQTHVCVEQKSIVKIMQQKTQNMKFWQVDKGRKETRDGCTGNFHHVFPLHIHSF